METHPSCPDQELLRRFHKALLPEPEAASVQEHLHLCPACATEVDQFDHQGRPFVVMDLIDGESLQERLRRDGRYADAREAAVLVRQVAGALQAVHDQGILHRDLKPGNILLNEAGNAVLTDFGLARLDDEHERLTAEDALPGTPAYMAPEQIDPEVGAVGPRSDVYSLGVVL